LKIVRESWVSLAALLVFLIMAIPSGAWATSVFIDNYSFETPVITTPGGWSSSLPGWTKSGGTSGVYYAGAPYFPAGAPDGHNVGLVHSGTIYQLLAETIQANHEYTLGVYVGRAIGTPAYTVQLAARDSGGVDHILTQTTSTASLHSFDYVQLSYLANTQYAGDQLKIILTSETVSGTENDFDKVTLSDVFVPTPSTALLLGSGLMGLTFLRRRHRAHR